MLGEQRGATLGKIWEEKYFCLCYAGFKSRTGREYDAEIHHRPQLLIRPGELPEKNDRPKAAIIPLFPAKYPTFLVVSQ